jgi:hypothetical protein
MVRVKTQKLVKSPRESELVLAEGVVVEQTAEVQGHLKHLQLGKGADEEVAKSAMSKLWASSSRRATQRKIRRKFQSLNIKNLKLRKVYHLNQAEQKDYLNDQRERKIVSQMI